GRVCTFTHVAVEIELNGDALRYSTGAAGSVWTVAEATAKGSQRVGAGVLDGEGDPVSHRIRQLEQEIGREALNVDRSVEPRRPSLIAQATGQLQPSIVQPGRSIKR